MTQMNLPPNKPSTNDNPPAVDTAGLVGAAIIILIGLAIYYLANTPSGSFLGKSLNQLFAIDSVQLMWYVTRSAGLISYFLLWLSTAWGLAVSSKIFDVVLHRAITYDFHQFISLLALGFIFLHIAVLMADRYLPYTLAQVLVPFLSPYRPLWVAIGVFAFYLSLLVTITFYLRSRIGMKTFRTIHYLSLLAYLGATVHGFFSGSDSTLITVQLLYAGTLLVIVFLVCFWLVELFITKRKANHTTEVERAAKAGKLRPQPEYRRATTGYPRPAKRSHRR